MEKMIYDGWLKLKKLSLRGREYEVIEQKDAVAALIQDKEGKILLVKQVRPALLEETLEIPAGCIDKAGKSLKEIMLEELEEEAHLHLQANDLTELITCQPQLGISKSTITLFHGRITTLGQSQLIDDDLDVTEIVYLTPTELERAMESGHIKDLKTQLAFYFLKSKGQL